MTDFAEVKDSTPGRAVFPISSMHISLFPKMLLVALIPCLATACEDTISSAQAEPAAKTDSLIARLDGHPVFRSDFEKYLSLFDDEMDEEAVSHRFQHFMEQLILYYDATQHGHQPENQEEASETAGAAEDSELAQQWDLRFRTVQSYIASCLNVAESITLNDLREFYRVHQESFLANEKLRVLEILVKERSLADRLRLSLKNGDFRTFREVAVKHSVGTHTLGELGVFEAGQLPPLFEKVIFSLKVGEISPVFPSQFGYHIFTVEERTPKHFQKFYEVQAEIFDTILTEREREAVESFVKERIEDTQIEIYDSRFERFWSSRQHAKLG